MSKASRELRKMKTCFWAEITWNFSPNKTCFKLTELVVFNLTTHTRCWHNASEGLVSSLITELFWAHPQHDKYLLTKSQIPLLRTDQADNHTAQLSKSQKTRAQIRAFSTTSNHSVNRKAVYLLLLLPSAESADLGFCSALCQSCRQPWVLENQDPSEALPCQKQILRCYLCSYGHRWASPPLIKKRRKKGAGHLHFNKGIHHPAQVLTLTSTWSLRRWFENKDLCWAFEILLPSSHHQFGSNKIL